MRRRNGPIFEPDKTFLKPKLARELALTYGTPLFVYDRKTLEAQVARVNAAFSWNPGHKTIFPVRYLHNPAVLRVLHQAGCRLLCGNAVELKLALMAGVPGEDLFFSAFFPDSASLELALSCGATIILDRGEQLEDIPLHVYGNRVLCLSVNHEQIQQSILRSKRLIHSKLGMAEQELMHTISRAQSRGFKRFAVVMDADNIGVDIGSMSLMTKYLLYIAHKVQFELGIRLRWCQIGRNMHWPNVHEPSPVHIEKEVPLVRQKWEFFAAEEDGWAIPIFTQVGSYLTMPAGLYITRVLGIKKNSIIHVGTDGGFAHMPKGTVFGRHYHTSKVGDYRLDDRKTVHLVGRIQENIDVLTKRQCLPPLKTGDLVVLHDAGAYGRSNSSNYGGTLRCPEILLDTDGPRLISRRETFDDYIACLQRD
ncbi:MAG: hypothetical protein E7459_06495 [Ruminococcaceae bacterium]|nr:hypothetical protein [Oscillospiraceae bacterium]